MYIKFIHPRSNIVFIESGHHSSCWAILVCDPVGPYEVGSRPKPF